MPELLNMPELIPGSGLGSIYFGMTPEEVGERLGPPAELHTTDEGEFSSLAMEYPPGACFFFGRENGWQLKSIEIDFTSGARFHGEPIFPRSQNQLLDLLQRHGFATDPEDFTVERNDDIEEISLYVPSLRATFYFDLDDNLQEVHWGVFFSPADEIVWPR